MQEKSEITKMEVCLLQVSKVHICTTGLIRSESGLPITNKNSTGPII